MTKRASSIVLAKTKGSVPKQRTKNRKPKLTPKPASRPAIDIHSVSKWQGAAAHIGRFARNESLQMLIELAMTIRHVKGHRKGRADDKSLEPLLRGITVSIEKGSVVGVIDIGGQSRAALIRILGNSEAPSTGVVRFFGQVAAFAQLGASGYDYLTCRQNLIFGARLVGIPLRDINAALERLPEFSGAGEHLDTPLRRLPRTVIGDLGVSFVCCLDYDILIADEIGRPRSEKVEMAWRDYLKQAPERGQTVILGSNSVSRLLGPSTHLLLIKAAELIAYGPAAEIAKQHADFITLACETKASADERSAAPDEEYEDDEIV